MQERRRTSTSEKELITMLITLIRFHTDTFFSFYHSTILSSSSYHIWSSSSISFLIYFEVGKVNKFYRWLLQFHFLDCYFLWSFESLHFGLPRVTAMLLIPVLNRLFISSHICYDCYLCLYLLAIYTHWSQW